MRKPNDRGGWPTKERINRAEHQLEDWERQADALSRVVTAKGISNVDESRRATESIQLEMYESLEYYERWIVSLERRLLEKGVLAKEEIDRKAEEVSRRWRAE